jgi:hypothetical protein
VSIPIEPQGQEEAMANPNPNQPPKPQTKPDARNIPNPAKLDGSEMPPPHAGRDDAEEHEERLIDEAVDESFPASDPPAIANPGSSLAEKEEREPGRKTPGAEGDARKKSPEPGGKR